MKIKKLIVFGALGLSMITMSSCVGNNITSNQNGATASTVVTNQGGDLTPSTSGNNQVVNPTTTNNGQSTTSNNVNPVVNPTTTTTQKAVTPVINNGTDNLQVTLCSGYLESIYAEFKPVKDATNYNVYVKGANLTNYVKVDDQLTRLYKNSQNEYYYRTDIVGLKEGIYETKIVPVINNSEDSSKSNTVTNLQVKKYTREGFAFTNSSSNQSASGAYNDDGTLRSDANVIYVTNSTKDTVKLTAGGKEYEGVQNIIAAHKKEVKTPLCVRFIGNVEDPKVLVKGDLYVDTLKGGITLEGIGKDATCNGYGITIKNSSYVELRNLGFMNCNSSEGDSISLQQGNDHVWVHNNDIFYGNAGSDKDQAKGDGALDTKTSTYITHSYNHFWDTGKSNLQGMKSEKTTNYITYHHNWYDHSDSRHPRIRTCSVHIYNNYFDGVAKYGVGVTMGASAFVENNYFRSTATMRPMLSSGQGTDADGEGTFSGENGGIIKAYNNKFDGNAQFKTQNDVSNGSIDAYVVSSRDEQVPSTVKTVKGGTTYNNFDTTSSLMYSYNVQTPDDAKARVLEYAGRVQGGDFSWTFNNSTDDADYGVISELKTKLMNYKGQLDSVQGTTSSSQTTTPEQGSGTPDPSETPETPKAFTAQDVIALIELLPESTEMTKADIANVQEAKGKYDELDSEEKAKVTNLSKLNACLDAIGSLSAGTEVLTFNTGSTGDNDYFTVTGNIKSSFAGKTYNGVNYNSALKMESDTYISFSANGNVKVTIVTDGNEKRIKINGEEVKTNSTGVYSATLNLGTDVKTVAITKGDSLNVAAIIVENQ